ncbi:hypothetical protein ILUMI_24185 [Ignelater luminosus]|uniref:Uncharacterized protein n=1 Tax=Ignelater luminosus TaxID=2038154 RepID=A0A8K0C9L9_IGNLU|nr:hypothetical protein ILUMI_24185 [Ignelater luminosus]
MNFQESIHQQTLDEVREDEEQHAQEDLFAILGTSSGVQTTTEGDKNSEKQISTEDIPPPSLFQNTKHNNISKWSLINSAGRDEIVIRRPASNELNKENYPKTNDEHKHLQKQTEDESSRTCLSGFLTAKEIASQAGIDPVFKSVRSQRRERLFEYEVVDEAPTNHQELFKMNAFYPMMDTI